MLYDAHLHLNLKAENPIQDLIYYLKNNNVEKATIILNEKKDMQYYEDLKKIDERKKLYFVFGLKDYGCINNQEVHFGIKIHPKLFKMTICDVQKYIVRLKEINPEVIIIDDFMYGSDISDDFYLYTIKEIANAFTEKKIIVAHAGGVNLIKHVMFTKLHDNVYYDLALTVNYFRNSSIEKDIVWLVEYMSERVMLGSDYPDFTIEEAKIALELYCKDYVDNEKIQNVEKNTYMKLY